MGRSSSGCTQGLEMFVPGCPYPVKTQGLRIQYSPNTSDPKIPFLEIDSKEIIRDVVKIYA